MKIWHLICDVDNFTNLAFDTEFDLKFIESFNGDSKIDTWVTPKFIRMDNRIIGNSIGLSSHIPVFDKTAVLLLKNELKKNTELLPIIFEEDEYYIVNVTKVLDCINLSKSQYKTFSDGRIMRFIKYAFDEKKVKDVDIFKLKGFERNRPFVSDNFRNIVIENNLTGFKFELVWDSETE